MKQVTEITVQLVFEKRASGYAGYILGADFCPVEGKNLPEVRRAIYAQLGQYVSGLPRPVKVHIFTRNTFQGSPAAV